MKIIVRMPNWLGDAVFNLPFLMKLSEKHEVTVVTKESLKELYFKFNTITFRNKEELYKKHLKLRGKYDAYIVTPVSFSSALAAYLARTRVRIGFSFDMRDSLLTKKSLYLKSGSKDTLPKPMRSCILNFSLLPKSNFIWKFLKSYAQKQQKF